MKADLLFTGSELLTGLVENTNAGYLSRRLGGAGIQVREQRVLPDDLQAIAAAMERSLRLSDVVIVTGGLGPTDDDLTREAAAYCLRRKLRPDARQMQILEFFFQERGLEMPEANRKQALVIEGSTPLDNPRGTAPGALIETGGKLLFLLPGPPLEMQPMFEEAVLPLLRGRARDDFFLVKTLKCTGLGESQLAAAVKDLGRWDNPSLSLAARGMEVHLQLKAHGAPAAVEELIAAASHRLRRALRDYLYGEDEDTLAAVVSRLLIESGQTLALAESCSGGLLADMITDVPGSSRFFKGGLVAYSLAAKEASLGLDRTFLEREGAVSEWTARAMASAARRKLDATIGVGITGVAGPDTDPDGRPLGLVYIAIDNKDRVSCREMHFRGIRRTVKIRAAQAALTMLWRRVRPEV